MVPPTFFFSELLDTGWECSALAIEVIAERLEASPAPTVSPLGNPTVPPPASATTPAPFPCSKAELLRALGKDRTHTKYLDQLIESGGLKLTAAPLPVGTARYLARFADSVEHDRVIGGIKAERLITHPAVDSR
jgi:hypothetical protein